ncbi:MAG: hypothetical protein ACRDJH_05370 [Thermomicrobiales bacterium]
MHPTMLTELLKSYHHEQIENHKKLVRQRRLEIHDRAWISKDGTRPAAVDSSSSLVAKIAEWLGRMRPARVG